MAKKNEETKAERAEAGVKQLGSLIVWLVGIGALVAALFFIFKPAAPPAAGAEDVGQAFLGYTDFVRPYVPPANLAPSNSTVDSWLQYFDKDSRQWFRENAANLSFIAHTGALNEWREFDKRQHESKAMQFLLRQAPFRGAAVQRSTQDLEAGTADLVLVTGSRSFEVEATRAGGRWLFQNMLGQQDDLNTQIRAADVPPMN